MIPHCARRVHLGFSWAAGRGRTGPDQSRRPRRSRAFLLQVLDPGEEAFPYRGRTIFESVGGTLRHETLKAGDLRDRYLDRLAERKDALTQLCRDNGMAIGVAPQR